MYSCQGSSIMAELIFRTSSVSPNRNDNSTTCVTPSLLISQESLQSTDSDVLSASVLHTCDVLVNCFLINVFGLLGIAGNVLNVAVLSRHGMKSSTNLLLMSLSVCDLSYVVTLCLRRSPCVISVFDKPAALTMEAVQTAFFLSLNTLFRQISSGHVLLISLERLLAVYSPLKVSQYFTQAKTIYYILSIAVFWMLIIFPIFVNLFDFRWIRDTDLNVTVGDVTYSDFAYRHWDELSILNILSDWVKGPLQFGVIATASTMTVLKIREYNSKRLTMTSSSPVVDVRAAKMLLTVCLAYLLTSCPSFIPTVLYLVRADLMSDSGSESRLGELLEMLTDLLGVISASVNFVIYVRMSKKFYSTYTRLSGYCLC